MWVTVSRLSGTETLAEWGTLVEAPRLLMRDGLAELDFGHDGAVVLNLDAEVLVLA
jgi:hypothetical protein